MTSPIALTGFENAQVKNLPTFIGDSQGQAFQATFGRTKDRGIVLYKEAAKLRYPSTDRPDALPYQGHDRRILRAPTETDEQYAARLLTAHEIWLWAGTPTAMVNIFKPYGYTSATCAVRGTHEGLASWDGNSAWFSRFAIYLSGSPGYWAADGAWSDTPPDAWDEGEAGETWDSTVTTADIDYIRASIREFKSPRSFPLFLSIQITTGSGTPYLYLPLGRTWDDESWTADGEAIWTDSESVDVWEDDVFVPPSGGWNIRN